MIETETVYRVLTNAFSRIIPTYREDAPENVSEHYCVLNCFRHTPIADQHSDQIFFYANFYGDDRIDDDDVNLIKLCDRVRNELDETAIGAADIFGGHLNFERTLSEQDNDFDINCRRQEWTARVFYR